MLNVAQILNQLIARENLSADSMSAFMTQLMSGQLTAPAAAALLTALRAKGETLEEIVAAARVMRDFSNRVVVKDNSQFVDIVGTGGDGVHTFNISTTCLFVVAAAGAKVAKHGNRSVSSKSGSADALEALGVNLILTPEQVGQCIEHTGIGFMFAPNHHPAMRHVAPIRRELGIRTVFNILGPLTNPANTPNTLMGVFSKELTTMMAQAMQELGAQHVLVVHSQDGMDEMSLSAPTDVCELKNGQLSEYTLTPEQFGLNRAPLSELKVNNPEESKAMLLSALNNDNCAARDVTILNAGLALYTAQHVDSIKQGIELAKDVIASGAALSKVNEFAQFTQQFVIPSKKAH
ncbi:anthranilate phosphoribosyltransferase [Hydromonas duriensis]|uniref:Anthranilate phosphoribosyltransferase n=1 Tax=Hydromonas duriensis TaxID=1527608 RepID=A0A4R6YBR3_9BURK|nr:anthranilate phosphoribosyltransferase [Hydromonas duriensis]TDR33049.1 anthranilate phosphoribosyltransferase [Hydromonas duriensis]